MDFFFFGRLITYLATLSLQHTHMNFFFWFFFRRLFFYCHPNLGEKKGTFFFFFSKLVPPHLPVGACTLQKKKDSNQEGFLTSTSSLAVHEIFPDLRYRLYRPILLFSTITPSDSLFAIRYFGTSLSTLYKKNLYNWEATLSSKRLWRHPDFQWLKKEAPLLASDLRR